MIIIFSNTREHKYICHFILISLAIILKITSVGKDMERLELSYTANGNVKWYNYCGKIIW